MQLRRCDRPGGSAPRAGRSGRPPTGSARSRRDRGRRAPRLFWGSPPSSAVAHSACSSAGERRRQPHVGRLVGDAHLERAERRVRTHVPPDPRVVLRHAERDEPLDPRLPLGVRREAPAAPPARGSSASTGARFEAMPVSSPAYHGEFADSASTTGSHGRIASRQRQHSSADGMPTWTCSPWTPWRRTEMPP